MAAPLPIPGTEAMAKRNSTALKVALAGAGMISWYHLVAWRNAGERVRVVAVCDPDAAKASARAEEFSIPGVYADADSMFAAGGVDVLCQKPMTPTLAESEALVRRTEGKVRLMVHENWRFRPWYRELQRWIAAGDLGDMVLARMAMITSGLLPDASGHRPSLERQPFMQHEAELMIAEVLIHHLDVMRFLCGELSVVAARTARTIPDVRGETVAAIFLETRAG